MTFSHQGNNSWLYQKAYYNGFEWDKKNEEPDDPKFFKQRLSWLQETSHIIHLNSEAAHTFRLATVYPGLATGVGVTHESKSKGELKLGFEFDYSLGMPVIRGHSVKGALRAAFPQQHNKNVKHKQEKAYQLQCWLDNTDLTMEGFDLFGKDRLAYEKIVAIEAEIFEGKIGGSLLSNYRQDVFFDSFIAQPGRLNSSGSGYLGTDSITPHKDPLKNPVPIPFLKVLPGVTFEFRFSLHNNGLLSSEQKLNLFKRILLENGIGAKTNVGYGQFTEIKNKQKDEKSQQENVSLPDEMEEIPSKIFMALKKGKTFIEGEVRSISKNNVVCVFNIETIKMKIVKKIDKIKGDTRVGKKLKLIVNSDYIVNQRLNCKIEVIE